MKVKHISKWVRLKGKNMEIGNFGNEGVIPESISCKGLKSEVEGALIVRDEIKGNLVLDDMKIGNHVIIKDEIEGLVQMNNCEVGGFGFIFKDNLTSGQLIVRNAKMKGIHLFKGKGNFQLIDLAGSEVEYLFLRGIVKKLILRFVTITKVLDMASDFKTIEEPITTGLKVEKVNTSDRNRIGKILNKGRGKQ